MDPRDTADQAAEAYRHVPYDIEIEQALLGVCLRDNAQIDRASEMLDGPDFYDPLHQRLFEMLVYLQTEGSVTPLILHAVMKSDPGVIEVGGMTYFETLRLAAPATSNVRDYANILKDLSGRRAIIKTAGELHESAYASPWEKPTADLVETAADELATILAGTKTGSKRASVKAGEAAHELARRIEAQAVAETPHGVKTGVDIIDEVIKALFPGKLLVAAGRPGHGKSVLGTNIAKNVATRKLADGSTFGIPVSYLSAELDNDELAARTAVDIDYDDALSRHLDPLSFGDFTGMTASPEHFTRYIHASHKLDELDLEFFDVSGMTLEWIEATCRRLVRKTPGHRLVIIDHLQLVDIANFRRGATRNDVQTEITKRLKALAKALGITILLLSQLNRDVEKREDKHPQIADLREGGSIEQDADIIILLVRMQLYAAAKIRNARNAEDRTKAIVEYDDAKGFIEISVPKNRGGKPLDGYRKCCIDPGASAIRTNAASDYDEQLQF